MLLHILLYTSYTIYYITIYIQHIYPYTILHYTTGIPPPDLRERYRHEPDRRRPAEGGHQGMLVKCTISIYHLYISLIAYMYNIYIAIQLYAYTVTMFC